MSESVDSIQRLENLLNARLVDDAVAAATAGVQFVSDVAKTQALGLVRQQLRVEGDAVKGADGKPGADYVRERLGSGEFAHFLKPSGHRGTPLPYGGGGEAALPARTFQGAADAPRSMGAAIIQHALAGRAQPQQRPDANADVSQPFGLKPTGRRR